MGEENNDNTTQTQNIEPTQTQNIEPTQTLTIDNSNAQTNNSVTGIAAAGNQPEDTAAGYLEIINQQTQQINALIEQTQRQQSEITRLIQNGAIITDGNQTPNQPVSNASALGGFADYTDVDSEDFVSFRDLGKYVGSKEMI